MRQCLSILPSSSCKRCFGVKVVGLRRAGASDFSSVWRTDTTNAGVVSLIKKASDFGGANQMAGAGPESVYRDVPYMYPNSVTMSRVKNHIG